MADEETVAETVDTNPGGLDITGALENLISELGVEAESPPAEPAKAVAEAPPVVETAVAVETKQEPPKAEAKVDPGLDRGWARLTELEAKVSEERKRVEAEAKKYATLVSQFRRDPIEALKAVGVPETEIPMVVRAAYARQLPPEKVPAQIKEMQAKLETNDRFDAIAAENRALRDELEAYKQAQVHEQHVNAFKNEVSTYLSNAENDAPHVVRLHRSNPQKATERIFAAAQAEAQSRMQMAQRGEQVPPITAADVVKRVEAELADLATLIGITPSTQPTTTTSTVVKPSLSARATQPPPPPKSKSDEAMSGSIVGKVDDWLKANNLSL